MKSSQTAFETTHRIRALHAFNRLLSRVYHHVEVTGVNSVPRHGPAIILCNHISGADPLMLQSAVHRPIIWMMASEYYDLPVLGRVFRMLRAIPVSRDGRDTAALRAALRALSDGALLGIFPEGRIATGRELLPMQTGAAVIAARAKVTIFPCHITGTTRGQEMTKALLLPNMIRLRFGRSIAPPPRRAKDLDPYMARLAGVMQNLASGNTKA